eukprot:3703552-Prymnesium_polylepis.1
MAARTIREQQRARREWRSLPPRAGPAATGRVKGPSQHQRPERPRTPPRARPTSRSWPSPPRGARARRRRRRLEPGRPRMARCAPGPARRAETPPEIRSRP